jgi:predicted ferric reductase
MIAYEFFLKAHFILAVVFVLALLKHVSHMGLQRTIFPVVAMSLWMTNTILRLALIIYNGRARSAILKHYLDSKYDVTATEIAVSLKRPLKVRPGQFVYLFLSDMGIRRRFQAHPFVITWTDNPTNAKKLYFLVQPQSGITSELMSRNAFRSVILDGPYGVNHHLEDYETVVLVAKGIGIAGVLPYAQHMTYRRFSEDEAYRRGLITRKLDIVWVLDDDCHDEWVAKFLGELRDMDPQNVVQTKAYRSSANIV